MDTKKFALPKPCHQRRFHNPGVKVMRDGREICQSNAAGRKEYKERTKKMVIRQKFVCGLNLVCNGKPLTVDEATFEHLDGRGIGGGRRDDRIVDENGEDMNCAACALCNSAKGSQRICKE